MQLTHLFICRAASFRKGIQDLLNTQRQSGGRGVCSGGKGRGESGAGATLQAGFGSRAKQTDGGIAEALPGRGSVQLRGSRAQWRPQSQPARRPSAGVGPQVSLTSAALTLRYYRIVQALIILLNYRWNIVFGWKTVWKISRTIIWGHFCIYSLLNLKVYVWFF